MVSSLGAGSQRWSCPSTTMDETRAEAGFSRAQRWSMTRPTRRAPPSATSTEFYVSLSHWIQIDRFDQDRAAAISSGTSTSSRRLPAHGWDHSAPPLLVGSADVVSPVPRGTVPTSQPPLTAPHPGTRPIILSPSPWVHQGRRPTLQLQPHPVGTPLCPSRGTRLRRRNSIQSGDHDF